MEEAQRAEARSRPGRGRPRQTEPSPEFLRRREEIIESAAKVFHDRGYEWGSLDDVAAEMGLRKASLYYYVESKGQLLYWIFDRAISLALVRLAELLEIEDTRERLAAFIAHQVCVVAEERSLFAVFFDNRPRLDDAYEDDIRSKERQYLQYYIDAVNSAVAEGVLPYVDPRHAAQAILGMCSWVYKWISCGEESPSRVAADFTELILRSRVPLDSVTTAPFRIA